MVINKPTSSDIWYARNQPYGYWRVGNPIVKLATLAVITVGIFVREPSLTFQGFAVVSLMVWAPFNPKSWFQIIFINFGLGVFFVGLLNPCVIPYDSLRFTWNIPMVAKIDGLLVIAMFCMMLAYIKVARVVTSRDYVWLIDIIPQKLWRKPIAASMYSHVYGVLRFPNVVWEANIAIRSRGGHSPFTLRILRSFDTLIDTFGLWLLYICRELKEVTLTIEYVIMSRVRLPKRKAPIWRSWSLTDYSIAGVLVFGVFLPQLGLFN